MKYLGESGMEYLGEGYGYLVYVYWADVAQRLEWTRNWKRCEHGVLGQRGNPSKLDVDVGQEHGDVINGAKWNS